MQQLNAPRPPGGWHQVVPVKFDSLDWKLFWIMRTHILWTAISVPSQL